ncbi:MAG: hypothetical protein RLY45_663 [Actinomycetota bacterium]
MGLFNSRSGAWSTLNGEAAAPTRKSVQRSFDRDPIDWASHVRIVAPQPTDSPIDLPEGAVLHVAAQFVAEARAQAAEYAAGASAAIREILADARARRFEAVQQAKARRLMLQSYRAALQRHADAQRILGPHVRFSGSTGKNLWILFFLVGDAAGMTLALTYGGESPFIAGVMALAVGAAVIVSGKLGEDLRRESFVKNLSSSGDEETERVVEAVFGVDDSSRLLNRKVLYTFIGTSSLAGLAIGVYRAQEESISIGIAFGMWALLIGAGSFAASWYYCDPARTFISLTQQAVDDAEAIFQSTEIDAIEEHNANIEAAKHIVREYRQRAEAAWNMTLAGAAAAMAANSGVIGLAQMKGHWVLQQRMPDTYWPDLSEYFEIVDRDDVAPDSATATLLEPITEETERPTYWLSEVGAGRTRAGVAAGG